MMVHCLPTVDVHRFIASAARNLAPGLAENVGKDLDRLGAELKDGNGRYLVRDHVNTADAMIAFSFQYNFYLPRIGGGKELGMVEDPRDFQGVSACCDLSTELSEDWVTSAPPFKRTSFRSQIASIRPLLPCAQLIPARGSPGLIVLVSLLCHGAKDCSNLSI